ncbi:hypothetical protein PRIC2_002143 [Phytophthora ramorum]
MSDTLWVEILALIGYSIMCLLSLLLVIYLRVNRREAFKGDLHASRKVILPAFEPLLWILAVTTGIYVVFFSVALKIDLYTVGFPSLDREFFYCGRIFSPPFLHRDIKPANFLLDNDNTLKLTNFSDSRRLPSEIPNSIANTHTNSTLTFPLQPKMTVTGTVDYMAPEMIGSRTGLAAYAEAADVYSLAITFWDMLYPHREKYPDTFNNHLLVFESVLSGSRPPIDEYEAMNEAIPPRLLDLITNSWRSDPNTRPSAQQLVSELEQIQEELLAALAQELLNDFDPENSGVLQPTDKMFTGGYAVDRMEELKVIESKSEGIRLGRALMDAGFLHHAEHICNFQDNDTNLYYLDDDNISFCQPLAILEESATSSKLPISKSTEGERKQHKAYGSRGAFLYELTSLAETVEIESSVQEHWTSYRKVFKEGEVVFNARSRELREAPGTKVYVSNLFRKLPVRRKDLSRNNKYQKRVIQNIQGFCVSMSMIWPSLSFDVSERFLAQFGQVLGQDLQYVAYSSKTSSFSIRGYFAFIPSGWEGLAKGIKQAKSYYQFAYLENEWVEECHQVCSRVITDAALKWFSAIPIFVLKVAVPSDQYDMSQMGMEHRVVFTTPEQFNQFLIEFVQPKTVTRTPWLSSKPDASDCVDVWLDLFEDDNSTSHIAITNQPCGFDQEIEKGLEVHTTSRSGDADTSTSTTEFGGMKSSYFAVSAVDPSRTRFAREWLDTKEIPVKHLAAALQVDNVHVLKGDRPIKISKATLANLQVIRQVDRKFILVRADTPRGKLLLCIDQHAADERVRLEKLELDMFGRDGSMRRVEVQDHEPPLSLQMNFKERKMLHHHEELVRSWGFDFELVNSEQISLYARDTTGNRDEGRVLLHATPKVEKRGTNVDDFRDFIQLLSNAGKTYLHSQIRPPAITRLLHSRACRSAIMFGDWLSVGQCKDLIEELKTCQLPFQCAHGRPSVVPLAEIQR